MIETGLDTYREHFRHSLYVQTNRKKWGYTLGDYYDWSHRKDGITYYIAFLNLLVEW